MTYYNYYYLAYWINKILRPYAIAAKSYGLDPVFGPIIIFTILVFIYTSIFYHGLKIIYKEKNRGIVTMLSIGFGLLSTFASGIYVILIANPIIAFLLLILAISSYFIGIKKR